MILNIFGQPSSGKTTLADFFLKKQQVARSAVSEVLLPLPNLVRLDGDCIRDIFHDKDYTMEGRRNNIQRVYNIALYLEKCMLATPVISFVSPFRDQRLWLSERTNVANIYLTHEPETRNKQNYRVDYFELPEYGDDVLTINTSDNPLSISYSTLFEHLSCLLRV